MPHRMNRLKRSYHLSLQMLLITTGVILLSSNYAKASTQINVRNSASFSGLQANDLNNDDRDGGGGGTRTAIDTGDVNGNGKEDILIGAPGVDNVSGRAYLFFGNTNKIPGQSLNEAAWFYSTGPKQWDTGASVVLADLDGDGYKDVVIGDPQFHDSSTGAIYILFGSQSGFTKGSMNAYQVNNTAVADVAVHGTTAFGWFGLAMVKGDFNNDNYDDIAVQERTGRVYLILGRPRASWPVHTNVAVTTVANTTINMGFGINQQNLWLSSGDLDNDGFDDLLIGNLNNSSNNKYLYYGRNTWPSSLGSFDAELRDIVANTGFYYGSFSMNGDVNGDGVADLLVETAQKAFLFLGNSSRLNGIVTLDLTNSTGSADAMLDNNGGKVYISRDLNGDGIDDIVLYQKVNNEARLYVYYGKSSGWSKTQSIPLTQVDAIILPVAGNDWDGSVLLSSVHFDGNFNRPAQLAIVAPFHDDGLVQDKGEVYLTDVYNSLTDIAVTNFAAGTVSVINNIDGSDFENVTPDNNGGNAPNSIAAGDFNNDGFLDLVVGNGNISGDHTLSFLLGDDTGHFGPRTVLNLGYEPSGIAVGDFNNDGDDDLLVSKWQNNSGNEVEIILGNGQGNFTPQGLVAVAAGSNALNVADFDQDGKLDGIVANWQAGKVTVLFGNGDGTFNLSRNLELNAGTRPQNVQVGDFNNDGLPDIIFAHGLTASTRVYLNNNASPGSFPTMIDVATLGGQGAGVVQAGDFNPEDNNDDFVTIGVQGGGIVLTVFKWNNNNFVPFGSPTALDAYPESLSVADFNKDGHLDVVAVNRPGNKISILFGDGNGNFTSKKDIAAGNGPLATVVGDFTQGEKVPNLPSIVRIDSRQIKIKKRLPNNNLDTEKPFFIKGVVWEAGTRAPVSGPSSIASCPPVPYGFFFDFANRCSSGADDLNFWLRQQAQDHYLTDIPLMKQLNANTVRTFRDFGDNLDKTRQILDEFYKNNIMVVMTVASSKNDLDNYKHTAIVNALKNHPAILMWALGNEWNLNNFFGYDNLDQAKAAVKAAAEALQIADENHPVTSSLGDNIDDISAIVDFIPEVDIWGLNIYRGASFGNLFSQLGGIPTARPYYLSEFGTDSIMTGHFKINAGRADDIIGITHEATQANHLIGLFNEIVNHRSTDTNSEIVAGGFVFEFNDELWKVGNYHVSLGGLVDYNGADDQEPTADDDTSYDEYNDEGYIIPGGHPDGASNEEHFGLVDADRNPKEAFNRLADAYKLSESVLYYNFDQAPLSGKVLDYSGKNNDGDVFGNVLFEVNGKKDGALQFDGISDAIFVPRINANGNASLNVSSGNQFTLAAWYKVTHSFQSLLLGWRENFPDNPACQYGDGVQMGVNISGFQWSGKGTGVNLMGGPCDYNRDKKVISISDAPLNEWHHLVIEYDQSAGAKIFLDGQLSAENPGLSGYAPLTGGDLLIGKSSGGSFLDFKGLLDDIRVYNFSLTDNEVSSLFDLANKAPVAVAGTDKTLLSSGIIMLDGSASMDPDNNDPISYFWEINSKPEGSSAMLTDPNAPEPSFTADLPGKYAVVLTVTDSLGKKSIPDYVIFDLVNPGVDTDSDGLYDAVDVEINTVSNDFDDQSGSFGTINRGNQNIIVIDDPDSSEGVRIIADESGGPIPAIVTACSSAIIKQLTPGDELVVTCGSVSIKMIAGSVDVEYTADSGDTATITLKSGDDVYFNTRTFTFENNGLNNVVISIGENQTVLKAQETFKVELPPIADAGPDQDVECTGFGSTEVTLDGSGTVDPNNDQLTYAWSGPFGSVQGKMPVVNLPLGAHTITLTVNDGNGGMDTDSVLVVVKDTTPPLLSVSVNPSVLWPPNHKMKLITPAITVSDICDSHPNVVLKSITMNESGNLAEDIQVDTKGRISLRAERSGGGNGRVYTIIYTATDASGNSIDATATVTVPHNK